MIADDHLAVRSGAAGLVEGTEIEVVCQAESCKQAIEYAIGCEPDVLLLDPGMPDASGLTALQEIKHAKPGIAVLMFTASAELKEMAQSHSFGAAGYLTKDLSRAELLQSIRSAAAGKTAWTPRQLRQITSRAVTSALAVADLDLLSVREREVLAKICEGLTNEAIAEALNIGVETVKQHVKHLLEKLHVEDRTQAALYALRDEMAPPPAGAPPPDLAEP
jgi:DNA-binding NarL/FixJ family response regulator